MTWATGAVYQGYFKRGNRHRKGKMISTDGSVYDGEWKDNKRDGEGTCKYPDGRIHKGTWKNGQMQTDGDDHEVVDNNGQLLSSKSSHPVVGGGVKGEHNNANADGVVKRDSKTYEANGESALRAGNFVDAVSWFTKAIDVDGSNHTHFSNRSMAYLRTGDNEAALDDANTAILLNPKCSENYYLKGEALLAMNRHDEATSAFDEGVKQRPDDGSLQEGSNSNGSLHEGSNNDDSLQEGLNNLKVDEETVEKLNELEAEESVQADSKADREPQPQDGVFIRKDPCNEVKQWLQCHLPRLQKQDVDKYCQCFVVEGFDSIDVLEHLEEEDLHFMKQGHKRALLKKLCQNQS